MSYSNYLKYFLSPFFISVFIILFIPNSFALDSEIIVNMPSSVSNLQSFPIEIFIPEDLRNNISTISFSSECGYFSVFPVETLIYWDSKNYSGEGFLELNAFIQETSSQKSLPFSCKLTFNFIYKNGYVNGQSFLKIEKNITLNPAKVSIDLPDKEFKPDEKKISNYKYDASWSYFNRAASCSTIGKDTVGIINYDVTIKYGNEYGASSIGLVLKRESKTLKVYIDEKTKYLVDEFLKQKYEFRIEPEIKAISIPGYVEAYELDLAAGTKFSDAYYGCYKQRYYIYAIDKDGQLLILGSNFDGRLDSESDVRAMFESNKKEMLTAASSFKLSETKSDFKPLDNKYRIGSDKKKVVEEKKTEEIEEQKEIAEKKFTIDFSGKNKKSIWNRGRFNTGTKEDDSFLILVKIDGQAYDVEGDRIKKISNDELFSGVKLVAKIPGKESQIGISSSLSADWSQSISSDLESIDVRGKGPHQYKSFYKPKETINVYLEWKGEIVSNIITYTVDVKDASPNAELKNPIMEVQDGDKRAIEFKVIDADKSKLKCTIMVPTGFAIKGGIPTAYLTHEGEETTIVTLDCKDGDNIKVIYNAPNFGNFDLNNELNALSMWKMQEGTMISLATDLVGVGVEKRLQKLESSSKFFNQVYGATNDVDMLQNAQHLEDAMNTLDKANGLSTDAQNIIKITQMNKNKNDLQAQANQSIGSGKQGWMEWGADWGVFGIDIAQSTVGAIAMAPGKIPVLGPLGKKVGAGFSTSFNLMTNVWRGNLAYLSKVEKINRAQEMSFPYPVLITIEDEDGFVTKDIQGVMVIYNWLD